MLSSPIQLVHPNMSRDVPTQVHSSERRDARRRSSFIKAMADLLALLLTSVGLTVVIVWPEDGPAAYLRDRVIRVIIPRPARGVLDCYICLGFWVGLVLSPAWWIVSGSYWSWFGCLMTPGLFWILLGNPSSHAAGNEDSRDERTKDNGSGSEN